jgi:hypothetical protein
LGRLLQNELNLEQLDVALGSGTVELRDVVLNCAYIREQLGDSAAVLSLEVGGVYCKKIWGIHIGASGRV